MPLRAEIIPSKPDAGNAAEGKRLTTLPYIPEVNQFFKKGMEIKLNGQVKTVPEDCTIQLLIDMVHTGKQNGIAVAVNSVVSAKVKWNEHFLSEHDDVLIIKAAQGG